MCILSSLTTWKFIFFLWVLELDIAYSSFIRQGEIGSITFACTQKFASIFTLFLFLRWTINFIERFFRIFKKRRRFWKFQVCHLNQRLLFLSCKSVFRMHISYEHGLDDIYRVRGDIWQIKICVFTILLSHQLFIPPLITSEI